MGKRQAAFSLALVLMAAGCADSTEPDDATPAPKWIAFPAALVGTWDWELSSGGFAGSTWTPASTGQQRAIRCSAQAECEWSTNAVVQVRLRVRLSAEQTPFASEPLPVFWGGDPPQRGGTAIRSLDNSRLVIVDLCIDCWSHTYRRRQ